MQLRKYFDRRVLQRVQYGFFGQCLYTCAVHNIVIIIAAMNDWYNDNLLNLHGLL